jgi:preprotein translocase subunit SecD
MTKEDAIKLLLKYTDVLGANCFEAATKLTYTLSMASIGIDLQGGYTVWISLNNDSDNSRVESWDVFNELFTINS